MKKIICSSVIALSMATTLVAGNIGVGMAIDMGLGVTAQFNGKINAQIGNDGICTDYLFIKNNIEVENKIANNLDWYIGAGLGYYWSDGKNKDDKIDLRVPVGLDLDFAKKLDFYLQVIPVLRVNNNVKFKLNSALGVRYYF